MGWDGGSEVTPNGLAWLATVLTAPWGCVWFMVYGLCEMRVFREQVLQGRAGSQVRMELITTKKVRQNAGHWHRFKLPASLLPYVPLHPLLPLPLLPLAPLPYPEKSLSGLQPLSAEPCVSVFPQTRVSAPGSYVPVALK